MKKGYLILENNTDNDPAKFWYYIQNGIQKKKNK